MKTFVFCWAKIKNNSCPSSGKEVLLNRRHILDDSSKPLRVSLSSSSSAHCFAGRSMNYTQSVIESTLEGEMGGRQSLPLSICLKMLRPLERPLALLQIHAQLDLGI